MANAGPATPHPAALDPDDEGRQHAADARYAIRGAVLQVAGVVAQGALALQQVLVPRLFGQAAHGAFAGAMGLVEILGRLGLAGADKGLHRFIAGHRAAAEVDLERRALGSGLRLVLLCGGLGTLVLAAGAGVLGGEAARAARWMSPAVLGYALTIALVAACLGRRAAGVSPLVRGLAEPWILIGAMGLAWGSGAGLPGLAAAHGVGYLLVEGVAALAARRVFGAGTLRAALAQPAHPELARFVRPVVGIEVLNTLRQRLDGLLVLAFTTPSTAALYFASDIIGRVAANVRFAFDGLAAPLFAEALHTGDRARLERSLGMLTRLVTLLAIPLAVTLVSLRRELLGLFGAEYLAAAALVPIHVAVHLANGTVGLAGHVLVMGAGARVLLVNQIAAALVNLVAALFLIPRFGLTGAAIAMALGFGVSLGTSALAVWRRHRVHPFSWALLPPALAGAAMLLVQAGVGRLIDPTAWRVAGVLTAGIAVYAALVALAGVAPEDRDALRSAWRSGRARRPA